MLCLHVITKCASDMNLFLFLNTETTQSSQVNLVLMHTSLWIFYGKSWRGENQMGILKTPECRPPSFIIIKAPEKLKTDPWETQVQTLTDEKEAGVQLDAWKTDFSMPCQRHRNKEGWERRMEKMTEDIKGLCEDMCNIFFWVCIYSNINWLWKNSFMFVLKQ